MSTGLKVLVIVGAALGVLVIVGILAAVAIPVFLNQRAKAQAAATTISLPAQMLGLTQLHDARSLQMEQQLRQQPGQPHVGVYGMQGSLRAAVTISKRAMSPADRRSFLAGAESEDVPNAGSLSWSDVGPGRLGGVMQCATATKLPFSICVFADAGAFGTITLFGPYTGRADVALALRESIEHRS
jgi:type II secretory pathway pseudopilin PulG